MQEFTIPTQEAGVPQPSQQNDTLPPIPPSDKTPDRISTQNPAQKEGKGGKSNCLVILLVISNIVLIAATGVLAYLYFGKKDILPEENQQTEETQTTTTTTQTPATEESYIYYTDRYNIYKAGKSGENQTQLTEYTASEDVPLIEVELINDNTIGFGKCNTVENDFGCTIYQLDIQTKEVDTVYELDGKYYLYNLTWLDQDKYTYAVSDDENILVIYFDGTKDNQLRSITLPSGGRGGFIEDDSQLKFSPEGDKLFFINTGARSGMDFNVDIFDLEGELIDKIRDATMPAWLDNDSIVYRQYSNDDAGYLYIRDLNTKESEKIEKSKIAAYNPKVNNDKIAFWEANGLGNTYVIDTAQNELTTISEDSAYILWLSEREVIFAKTRACTENECQSPESMEYFNQFVVDKYFIYDLNTKKEAEISVSNEFLENGILTDYDKCL